MSPATLFLIALALAFLAIGISGLGRGGRGIRPFLADLRFWGRPESGTTGSGAVAETGPRLIAVPAVEVGGIDDIFDIGTRPEHAYLEPHFWLSQRSAQKSSGEDTHLTAPPPVDTPLTASPAVGTAA